MDHYRNLSKGRLAKEFISITENYGFKNIVRPEVLASETTKHVYALDHALNIFSDFMTILMASRATIIGNQHPSELSNSWSKVFIRDIFKKD